MAACVQVAVKTSNLKGCGTDASVYLQLFGEGPDKQPLQSANFKLDNSPTNFTRDAVGGGGDGWMDG